MNAKEARQLTLRSINLTNLINLTKYVEDEISEKVHRFAEDGLFNGEVFIHRPDWFENYYEFRNKTKDALDDLGYEVLGCDFYYGGISYNIKWSKK